jgi:hypothetical protein
MWAESNAVEVLASRAGLGGVEVKVEKRLIYVEGRKCK